MLLHHRYLNGRGYPPNFEEITGQKSGPFDDNKIRVITQILTVADIYDSLTSERAYKKPFGSAEIIDIFSDMTQAGMLDPTIVKALIAVVGFYPIGAKVTINSGPLPPSASAGRSTHSGVDRRFVAPGPTPAREPNRDRGRAPSGT